MWTQAFSESIYIFSIDCETHKNMNTRNNSTHHKIDNVFK